VSVEITYRLDPVPSDDDMRTLLRAAWNAEPAATFAPVLARSLMHVGAYAGQRLVGFVNVATDGGVHAFLLDTTVDPDFQHRGIGTELVERAAAASRERGASWLHVDYDDHHDSFYRGCGFKPTLAGLIKLK
jgi:ribosomal protein S18 acetylase RimI-like enzyme